ncbi:hypothetical protein [Plastoroseomonas arctica]|uniref:Uncharacterized protein n=1 Tax=Plastoroseomonas arctica TaxID=1509237 RepID=A0AAF1KN00_9PROT|nr:hypothetical protein [Plastoroseomonas arctica]MBR0656084.1 hypothetical protein [Plastoroseomonas arctica]
MNARPPRHWIKRPPRPSRPAVVATPPTMPRSRRVLIAAVAGVAVGFCAAYVAANTHPDPALTWAGLGFGGALGAAFAWRFSG